VSPSKRFNENIYKRIQIGAAESGERRPTQERRTETGAPNEHDGQQRCHECTYGEHTGKRAATATATTILIHDSPSCGQRNLRSPGQEAGQFWMCFSLPRDVRERDACEVEF
jgi:hypothetical protein